LRLLFFERGMVLWMLFGRRSSNRQGCWTSKQSLNCLAYLAAMFIGWRIAGECPDR